MGPRGSDAVRIVPSLVLSTFSNAGFAKSGFSALDPPLRTEAARPVIPGRTAPV